VTRTSDGKALVVPRHTFLEILETDRRTPIPDALVLCHPDNRPVEDALLSRGSTVRVRFQLPPPESGHAETWQYELL
jgi:hypothetical protein